MAVVSGFSRAGEGLAMMGGGAGSSGVGGVLTVASL